MRDERDKDFVRFMKARLTRTDMIPPPREDTTFRMSAIPHLCAREEVLCAMEGVTRTREIADDLGLTFGIGTAVHWWLQNEVFAPMIWGRWKCLGCAAVHENPDGFGSGSWIPRPTVCGLPRAIFTPAGQLERIAVCQSAEFLFLETEITDPNLGIVGHLDGGLLYQNGGQRVVLEVKTMNVFKFEKAQGPEPEHRVQATGYGHLSQYQWILVLVMVKHLETVTSTFRPWLFRFDQRLFDVEIKQKVASIREGIAKATLPKRICYVDHCDRARKCSVRKQCFAVAS